MIFCENNLCSNVLHYVVLKLKKNQVDSSNRSEDMGDEMLSRINRNSTITHIFTKIVAPTWSCLFKYYAHHLAPDVIAVHHLVQ